MRILYFITKSNWGGAQKYVYDLAAKFNQQGHKIVVASGGEGELFEKLKEVNIETVTLGSMGRNISFVKDFKTFIDTTVLIYKEKPTIVHLNSSKAGGLGALISRFLRVKTIVFTVHGAPFREDRNYISKKIIYFLTWITCLLSHKIITVSRKDERDISSMWFVSKKVKTIYPGLPFDELPERKGRKSKKTHIVTIGELHKNKGLIYGLGAIKKLADKYDISYALIGEGEERVHLEKYIKDNHLEDKVTLLGNLPDASKKLKEYDIFILPSIKEGLPYVLIEAGHTMMPVVSTITGGIPEIIRHEETGLLVRPKDVNNLAKEIERLIVDRNLAKTVGQNLHSHITQHFSQSKMIAETAKVYGII